MRLGWRENLVTGEPARGALAGRSNDARTEEHAPSQASPRFAKSTDTRFVVASWAPSSVSQAPSAGYLGNKAAGLLRLPASWVPRFLVFTTHFSNLLRQSANASVHDILLGLPPDDRALVEEFLADLRSLQPERPRKLLLRSNGPTENFSSRGEFRSFAIQPTLPAVADAIAALLASARDIEMCPLLQPAVEPATLGHMSNERRLTRRRRRWLVEWLARTGGGPQQHYLTCKRGEWTDAPLLATTEKQVIACVRSAASFLIGRGSRWHCEWVWDGHHVWMVQADEEIDAGAGDADKYLASRETWRPTFVPRFGLLQHFRDLQTATWRKLQRPRTFLRAQLPTADVFVLPGTVWSERDSETRARIRADLTEMVRNPVVARTDLSEDVSTEDILLPTSPPAEDADLLIHHMDEAAAWFASKGLTPERWAFLLAYLVPARASAMVHAYPKAQRVRIDALWGFPDGLLHFPHDSYYYDVAEKRIARRIRYKGLCLLPEGTGWTPRRIGPRFDWQPVLSDDEIAVLADWGLRLARELHSELQLMVLARIGGQRGATACLPWHYTTWSVPPYSDSLRALPLSQAYEVITSYQDLERVRSQHTAPSAPRAYGYLLRPSANLLRDDDFLKAAAAFAAEHRRPLYFEGSLLGHAYYVMVREGAIIVPIVEDEPPSPTRLYRKLVRDRIPLIIAQAGGLARVRSVRQPLAERLLAQKLIEEAFEVWKSDAPALVEELSDVLDVVDALAAQAGITQDNLQECRAEKVAERGGFDRLVFLEETHIRRLRVEREQQGRLPLLTQDVAPSVERGTQLGQQGIVQPVPDARPTCLLSFEVPLVPPIDDSGPVPLIEAKVGAYRLELRYSGSRLRVSLRPGETPPAGPAHQQLELFLGNEGSPE